MSDIFLTSDLHMGHSNILKYCPNRGFSSIDEMHERLIQNWNDVVKPKDEIFNLGDFSFHPKWVEGILPRLNGIKHLILGNHDWPHPANRGRNPTRFKALLKQYCELGFKTVSLTQRLEGTSLECFLLHHMPYDDSQDVGSDGALRHAKHRLIDEGMPLLCGHVHQHWLFRRSKKGTPMLNVGIDAPGAPWHLRPANIVEVLEAYTRGIKGEL